QKQAVYTRAPNIYHNVDVAKREGTIYVPLARHEPKSTADPKPACHRHALQVLHFARHEINCTIPATNGILRFRSYLLTFVA
ncbi:MAG: hypothetical protein CMF12_04950, partial [Idiomarina sp.]|nr:hypothetical protein [Idiomarina sp.]